MADLNALTVPKDAPASTPDPKIEQNGAHEGQIDPNALLIATKNSRPSQPGVVVSRKYAHTLSLRLTAEQYKRLRRFVIDYEEDSGARMTHQFIIESALDEYLDHKMKKA